VDPDHLDTAELQDKLRLACLDTFGIDLTNFRARLANLRTAVLGLRQRFDLAAIVAATHKPKPTLDDAIIGRRSVWFGESYVQTPVYQRAFLPIGAKLPGPAIVNQMDTTTVVAPGDVARVDEKANLIIEVKK
jgi:N-methylhydantoinase A